jgi:indole-3-glycerol phosphate synthase
LRARIRDLPAAPRIRSHPAGFDLIAELKRRSPAAGVLAARSDEDVATRVAGYAEAGAAAVSVLTEPKRFDGTLADLEAAARTLASSGVPAMRKDFLVDPYQVAEARAAGAGGVLVILRMVQSPHLAPMLDSAAELGLFVLLEAFDERDLERAHELVSARAGQSLLVGVNCRDLATLQVVPERLETLAAYLPPGVPRVAESGLATPADARRIVRAGYDFALVGSALMTSPDSAAVIRGVIAAGRGAA